MRKNRLSGPVAALLALCLTLALGVASSACAELTDVTTKAFSAEAADRTDGEELLRGYEAGSGYVYLTFGNYPYEKDGTTAPCLWRVLAVENDYAFLLNEYVVDASTFHHEKVDQPSWQDYDLCTQMNTTMLDTMFTAEEQAAVRDSVGLGKLFILDNAEWMNTEYGFRPILTEVEKERECWPTPWAIKQGAYVYDGGVDFNAYPNCYGRTWYWSRSCRNTAGGGYEHILGYNGHISMSGYLRMGGIRPACYVDRAKLDGATGSGTMEAPYVFTLK